MDDIVVDTDARIIADDTTDGILELLLLLLLLLLLIGGVVADVCIPLYPF